MYHLIYVHMHLVTHTYALDFRGQAAFKNLCSIQYAIEELRQQLQESTQAQEDIKAEARQVCKILGGVWSQSHAVS